MIPVWIDIIYSFHTIFNPIDWFSTIITFLLLLSVISYYSSKV